MAVLADPEREMNLMAPASALARAHQNGVVDVVHIAEVPYQTPLKAGTKILDNHDTELRALLDAARSNAELLGTSVNTHTIFSHDAHSRVFDVAHTLDADLLVIGWEQVSSGSPGRLVGLRRDLLGTLSRDILAYKDRGFDPSKILVPIRGGPSSALGGKVARFLQREFGSEVTLLRVVSQVGEKEKGAQFLREWARDHQLEEARRLVDVSKDVARAIHERAEEHTLLILGASGRGLIERCACGSEISKVVRDVEISVLVAERPHERTLKERIFG